MGIIAVRRHVAGLARVQEHCQFARSLATSATTTGLETPAPLRAHVVTEFVPPGSLTDHCAAILVAVEQALL